MSNRTQVDMSRVKAAVVRLSLTGAISSRNQDEHAGRPPVDAALRRPMPLGKRKDRCPGFYCKDFLHGF